MDHTMEQHIYISKNMDKYSRRQSYTVISYITTCWEGIYKTEISVRIAGIWDEKRTSDLQIQIPHVG